MAKPAIEPGELPQKSRLPDELPVMPIEQNVAFPVLVLPLQVQEEQRLKLVEQVILGNKLFVAVTAKKELSEPALPDELYQVGTTCVILQMLRIPDGSVRLLAQGLAPADAAHLGVFVHGECASEARRFLGIGNLVAGDLPEAVARVLERLSGRDEAPPAPRHGLFMNERHRNDRVHAHGRGAMRRLDGKAGEAATGEARVLVEQADDLGGKVFGEVRADQPREIAGPEEADALRVDVLTYPNALFEEDESKGNRLRPGRSLRPYLVGVEITA